MPVNVQDPLIVWIYLISITLCVIYNSCSIGEETDVQWDETVKV